MKLNYLTRSILSLLIGVGIFSNFIHCAAVSDFVSNLYYSEQNVVTDHNHSEQGTTETCCDEAQEETVASWNGGTYSKISFAAILPKLAFQFHTKTIPLALKYIASTKEPPHINKELLAIKTIRLRL